MFRADKIYCHVGSILRNFQKMAYKCSYMTSALKVISGKTLQYLVGQTVFEIKMV